MGRTYRAWLGALALTVAATLWASPAQAQISKYLPNDTESVMTLNVRQMLDSPLVKKNGLDHVKDLVNTNEDLKKILDDLGLDPFKDIHKLIFADSGGSDPEKGLIIIEGKFNEKKIHAKAEQAAKDNADNLKIIKIEQQKVWEVPFASLVPLPNAPEKMYVALLDKNTLVAAAGKTPIKEAIQRSKGQSKLKLGKDLKTLLEKTDAKQSLSFVTTGDALAKSLQEAVKSLPIQIEIPEKVLTTIKNLKGITGGITLTEGLNLQLGVGVEDADTAKKFAQQANAYLNIGKAIVALQAGNDERWAPAADILNTVRITAQGNLINGRGEISAENLEKIVKTLKSLIPQ
jgi:hypothetical protein